MELAKRERSPSPCTSLLEEENLAFKDLLVELRSTTNPRGKEDNKKEEKTIGIIAKGFPEKEISRELANNLIAQLAEQALEQELPLELPRWGLKKGGVIATLGRPTTRGDVDKALERIDVKGMKFYTVEAEKLAKATQVALYVSNKDIKLTTILGLVNREHKPLNTKRWTEVKSKAAGERGKEFVVEMGSRDAAYLKKYGPKLGIMGGAIKITVTFLK